MKKNIKVKPLQYLIRSKGHHSISRWNFNTWYISADSIEDALKIYTNQYYSEHDIFQKSTTIESNYFIQIYIEGELTANNLVHCSMITR